jgi:hypothetical protein
MEMRVFDSLDMGGITGLAYCDVTVLDENSI